MSSVSHDTTYATESIASLKKKKTPKKQTCDGSAKALLTYSARSFPYQVLHITVNKCHE
jgi:hypothetical protein